jgi:Fe-S oxidoreductase
MRKILLIDGIGDFSIITENYKVRIPDTKLLYIGGLCRDLGIKAKYIDFRDKESSREMLFNYIESEKYNTVFININQDNKVYFDILGLNKIDFIDVFQLVDDNFFIPSGTNNNYFLFSEKIDIEQNIKNLLARLNIGKNILRSIFSLECDYKLLGANIKKYIIPINVGAGCRMRCSFCSIADTHVFYKSIKTIEKELDYLFSKGCNYFFIQNHSFCMDLAFVAKVCRLLISKYSNMNYVWSFWGNIEILKSYDKSLCELLIKSKLTRIELGVESVCEKISQDFGLLHNVEDVESVIRKFYNLNLKSYQINLIIGSQFEDSFSIDRTINFIKDIYNLFPGIIDFQINYFYFDNNNRTCEGVTDIEKIDYSLGYRKKDCFHSSNTLSIEQIRESKCKIIEHMLKYMKSSISRMSIRDRYSQLYLKEYGIYSQIYIVYLLNESTSMIYTRKKKNSLYLNSWEIYDDIKQYSPILLSPVIDINTVNSYKIIAFSPLLVSSNDKPAIILTKQQEQICSMLKAGFYNISEILTTLNMENEETTIEKELFDFLHKLEIHDLLLYVKKFNN